MSCIFVDMFSCFEIRFGFKIVSLKLVGEFFFSLKLRRILEFILLINVTINVLGGVFILFEPIFRKIMIEIKMLLRWRISLLFCSFLTNTSKAHFIRCVIIENSSVIKGICFFSRIDWLFFFNFNYFCYLIWTIWYSR